MYDDFKAEGVEILAVAVDEPTELAKVKRNLKLEYNMVSDAEGHLMDSFNLRHVNGSPMGGDIARSATVLLNSEGKVVWKKVADNYRVRPNHGETLLAVKEHISGN